MDSRSGGRPVDTPIRPGVFVAGVRFVLACCCVQESSRRCAAGRVGAGALLEGEMLGKNCTSPARLWRRPTALLGCYRSLGRRFELE